MGEQATHPPVNLEEVICTIKQELCWPLNERWGREGFRVESDAGAREHIIWWPRVPLFQETSYIAYIHELIHALFAEQVHPLFSSIRFIDSGRERITRMLPFFRAAGDWFVEHAVFERCGDRKSTELRAQHAVVRSRVQSGSVREGTQPGHALILAEAHLFLGHSIPVFSPWKELVESFLRTPADNPSVFLLNALTNRLLHIQFHSGARIVHSHGQHAWRIHP